MHTVHVSHPFHFIHRLHHLFHSEPPGHPFHQYVQRLDDKAAGAPEEQQADGESEEGVDKKHSGEMHDGTADYDGGGGEGVTENVKIGSL